MRSEIPKPTALLKYRYYVTLPSSDSTTDLENMGVVLPSLMVIISWIHQSKSLLQMKHLVLTLQRLDSLLKT